MNRHRIFCGRVTVDPTWTTRNGWSAIELELQSENGRPRKKAFLAFEQLADFIGDVVRPGLLAAVEFKEWINGECEITQIDCAGMTRRINE